MNAFLELVKNDTAVVSMLMTAFTGVLTGPILDLDAAAVGSITGLVAILFNLWVRASVYSKKGAAQAVMNAATTAVAAITPESAGGPGAITPAGEAAVAEAAKVELNVDEVPDPTSNIVKVA